MPPLPDELIEEVFLRLPPDKPEHLVRASLSSKLWLRLHSGPRFRGRYRDFHRAPPMLGFFYSWHLGDEPEEDPRPHFVSTTKCDWLNPDEDWGDAWDCRHGRVLLGSAPGLNQHAVWDPMSGCLMHLHLPKGYPGDNCDWPLGVGVLCAMEGCDHRACHEGPFRVVFVDLQLEGDWYVASARTVDVLYPEKGTYLQQWSELCAPLHLPSYGSLESIPPVLVQGAFHFMVTFYEDPLEDDDYPDDEIAILKYDLGSTCLSLIELLDLVCNDSPLLVDGIILMAMEDGSLGFAHVDGLTIYLWSRQMGTDGVASWTQLRVVDVMELLSIQDCKKRLRLPGSVEGTDIIFVSTDLGIYEVNLKSLQKKKRCERQKYRALIPYMSFYHPPGTSICSFLSLFYFCDLGTQLLECLSD